MTEAPLNKESLDPENSSTLCQDMSAVSERTGDVSPVEEALENAAEDENRFVGLNGHLVSGYLVIM